MHCLIIKKEIVLLKEIISKEDLVKFKVNMNKNNLI
jgi:hypothetical protein